MLFNSSEVKQDIELLEYCKSKTSEISDATYSVGRALRYNDTRQMRVIAMQLDRVRDELNGEIMQLIAMKNALEQVTSVYEQAERNNIDTADMRTTPLKLDYVFTEIRPLVPMFLLGMVDSQM